MPSLIPIIGLTLGIVALLQISHSSGKGKNIAWIAVILSSVFLLGIVLLVLLRLKKLSGC